jgi:hypothetical protein
LIARLLSFTKRTVGSVKLSDVKADPDSGANITGEHFATPGDGSQPLPEDYVVLVKVRGNGRYVAVGYADTLNESPAGPGETYKYARDAAGAIKCKLWLKADGTIRGENDNGYFELKSTGDLEANGATMKTDGDVVTSDNISLRNHVHGGVTTGGGITGAAQ